MSTTKDYTGEAEAIAKRLGLEIKVLYAQPQACPKWGAPDPRISRNSDCRGGCGGVHGNKYRVVLRKGARAMAFDYWGSQHDATNGREPSTYDILACVSSDMNMPTDPDEVVEELGPMKPSQAIAAAKFAQRLQAFFTDAERDALSEVS